MAEVGLNRADRLGLFPVRSAVWRDIVFVDLSGDAKPFEDFIQPLADRIANWTESELRPLGADEYEIQANWKLAAENFVDIYHLLVLHSQWVEGFSGALATEAWDTTPQRFQRIWARKLLAGRGHC